MGESNDVSSSCIMGMLLLYIHIYSVQPALLRAGALSGKKGVVIPSLAVRTHASNSKSSKLSRPSYQKHGY